MTTGSYTTDNRSYPTLPGLGGSWIGSYTSKTWNGGDRPKIVREPPQKVTVTRYSKTIKYVRGKPRVTGRTPYSYSFYRKRTGISAPPKRARDVDHAYVMSYSRVEDELQSYVYQDVEYFRAVMHWNQAYSVDIQNLSFDDNDQIKLIGKLREKISGSDFNLAVMLGEGRETLRMIGDTAIRIAKGLHHLRKGDLAGTARSLLEGTSRKPLKPYKTMRPFRPTVDRMSSHWLELQYGWKPLLKDVQAGAEFVAHKLSVPQQQTYRMSLMKEARAEQLGPDQSIFPGVKAWSHRQIRRSLIVRVKEPPSLIAQLGLLDPEIVAWELLPFSFVADWFIPIGSWLEARAAVSHCVIENYVQTTVDRTTDGTNMYSSRNRFVTLNRVVADGAPPVPLPRVKPLSQALSVGHVLNAIALLAQAAVGRSKTNERNRALTDSLPPSDPRNGLIPSASERRGRSFSF